MPVAWRLVKTRYAASAFDGEGARLYGGRWTSPGRRAVYASATIALATLEVLVHLDSTIPLDGYSVFEVAMPPRLVRAVRNTDLPPDWDQLPAPPDLRAIGDRWLAEGRSAVLEVPSAVVPLESNYLLNPRHPDFTKITVGPGRPSRWDSRIRR